MRRSQCLGTALVLTGVLAFGGNAMAFGGLGGAHAGGMGGGMGAHMGGIGGPGAGLQTGRSVAQAPNVGTSVPQAGGMGQNPGRGPRQGHGGHGGYGYGFGGFGYGLDDYGYGYGDGYPYDGTDYGYYDGGEDGLYSGRSAAEPGRYCATPVRTCTLGTVRMVGEPCSCRVPGGRAGGHVAN